MKHTFALAAMIMLASCGERMDETGNATTDVTAEPAPDIATNASAVADYARRQIAVTAPEIVKPGRTLNGRICQAAMARSAHVAEDAVRLESVDGNTTRLTVPASHRECLVDRDTIVWREIPRTGRPTGWKDDGMRYRIDKKGDIEIVPTAPAKPA